MGQLADRLAHLTTRYGSDAAAWQHELHALAALEQTDQRAALEKFYALKRRLAEFRRAQLLRELKAFAFVADVPSQDTRGYPVKEIEADIREATRALGHARAIERALRDIDEARSALVHRALSVGEPMRAAAWDALAPLAEEMERRRRVALREARIERRWRAAEVRARKLAGAVALPDARLGADILDAALDEVEPKLDAAEALAAAYAKAIAPLKFAEVSTYKHESKRKLEREAADLRAREDVAGLRAVEARAEALRKEAAALASQAARSRRRGVQGPQGERRPGDGIDPYG